jgi:hypothetical protein
LMTATFDRRRCSSMPTRRIAFDTVGTSSRMVGRVTPSRVVFSYSAEPRPAEIDGESKVALEATCGWEWLAELLEDAGYELHLAHPLRTKGDRRCARQDRLPRCAHTGSPPARRPAAAQWPPPAAGR